MIFILTFSYGWDNFKEKEVTFFTVRLNKQVPESDDRCRLRNGPLLRSIRDVYDSDLLSSFYGQCWLPFTWWKPPFNEVQSMFYFVVTFLYNHFLILLFSFGRMHICAVLSNSPSEWVSPLCLYRKAAKLCSALKGRVSQCNQRLMRLKIGSRMVTHYQFLCYCRCPLATVIALMIVLCVWYCDSHQDLLISILIIKHCTFSNYQTLNSNYQTYRFMYTNVYKKYFNVHKTCNWWQVERIIEMIFG